MGSLGGTSATGACWPAACNSLSASEVTAAPLSARSGAVKGTQPNEGSTNRSSNRLSLPLTSGLMPRSRARLAAVSCAVVPLRSNRYAVVTLSLWSMSTRLKSRVVGHGLPSRPICTGGTVSFPAVTAALAAVKNAGALQYANWPNGEFGVPFTHLPAARLFPFPRKVSVVPLKPNQIPTTAPSGSCGVTGTAAGRLPLSTTSGSYTDSVPVAGSTIVAWTKADCAVLASWQAPWPRPVACNRYGHGRAGLHGHRAVLHVVAGRHRYHVAVGGVEADRRRHRVRVEVAVERQQYRTGQRGGIAADDLWRGRRGLEVLDVRGAHGEGTVRSRAEHERLLGLPRDRQVGGRVDGEPQPGVGRTPRLRQHPPHRRPGDARQCRQCRVRCGERPLGA